MKTPEKISDTRRIYLLGARKIYLNADLLINIIKKYNTFKKQIL